MSATGPTPFSRSLVEREGSPVRSANGLTLLATERAQDGLRLRFAVALDSPYFEGHLPGEPLLPGVAQLDLVMQAAREWLPEVTVRGLRGVRLRRPIVPGAEFEVVIRRAGAAAELRFEVVLASGPATTGTLLLAAVAGA